MFTLWSHHEPETLAIGRAIGGLLRAGDVVAIDGPLGAGKTRLARGIALGLGFDGSVVSSPTYVMVNEYVLAENRQGDHARPRRLFHVDAYRLSSAEDLDSLGWDRVMSPESDAAVAIEWADRITEGEGGLIELHKRASADPERIGPEPGLCRVRMDPVEGLGEPSPRDESDGGEHDALGHGLRRITIEPPEVWKHRSPGAWRDLVRLTNLLSEENAARAGGDAGVARSGLPRGWARCATTGRPVPPDAPTFPFADSRARLADLGRWMSGAYTISREIRDEDEGEVGLSPGSHPS